MTSRSRMMLAAVLVTLAVPAGAMAAYRLGPDLSQPLPSGGFHLGAVGCQSTTYSPCSFVNAISTNPDAVAAAPTDGIITKWRFRAGCCTEPQTESRTITLGTFKLAPANGYPQYVWLDAIATGNSFVIPPGNQVLADAPTELPARMPIHAGELIGLLADYPIGVAVYDTIPNITFTVLSKGYTYGYPTAAALAIEATVEPDADKDGYGDETQDCTPADAALHESCPTQSGGNVVDQLAVGVNCPAGGCGGGTGGGGGGAVAIVVPSAPPYVSPDGLTIYVPLKCPATATTPCGGFLVIEPAGAKAAAVKRYGRTKYSVAAGTTAKVRVRLSTAARKLLKRKGRLKVVVTIQPDGGTPISSTRTLKAPKKPKKAKK